MPNAAPTKDDLLDVLRRTTPEEYHQGLFEDEKGSIALYRAIAKMWADVAARGRRTLQAQYRLPHSRQLDEPAGSALRATFSCTIRRDADRGESRFAEAGSMRLVGPQGRGYSNRDAVEWAPFDEAEAKAVVFEAEAAGWVFNLGHIADPNGLITTQAGEPDTSKIDWENQSLDRVAMGGSIVAATSLDDHARLVDTDGPDAFRHGDVGLYAKIVASAHSANVGRVLRVLGFEQPFVEDPEGSSQYPRRLIVDDGPIRTQLMVAFADDGGSFTEQTAASRSAAADDMTLLPAAPAVNDAYYFGAHAGFRYLAIDLSTAGAGTYSIAWEYWNGAAWVAFSGLSDGTDGLARSGEQRVTWTMPTNWASTVVNGRAAFWARARVSAFTSITTQPLGRIAYSGIQTQLVAEAGTLTWQILDWSDMAFTLAQIGAPAGGRDDMLRALGPERGLAQQQSEPDDTFRDRLSELADCVTPNAIRRIVNRALEPFGLVGQAFDVGQDLPTDDYFHGFFADVDFADYYEPGDVYPLTPYHLALSDDEAYGWFFVVLPYLGGGEFGAAADSGPVFQVGSEFFDSAADYAFADGYPSLALATYASIWNQIYGARMGQVGFTLLRDAALNVAPC